MLTLYFGEISNNFILIRKNAHSRYREGDPILHVKEIVDSPIYLRRGANAALKHIHTLKDKVAAQNAHLGQIDEVRNDIYRASKKNFATTRKTSDVLRYYDSQIKMLVLYDCNNFFKLIVKLLLASLRNKSIFSTIRKYEKVSI